MDANFFPQLGTTNLLLGILAFATLAQVVMLVALALWMRQRLQQVSQTITEVAARAESRVAPVLARIGRVSDTTHDVLTKANAVAARVTHAVDAIDHDMRSAAARMGRMTSAVTRTTNNYTTQVRAVEAGIKRGIAALRSAPR